MAPGARTWEYLAHTEADLMPATCSVRIHGTKTAASNATVRVSPKLWPWIRAAVPAPVAYKWLRTHWKFGYHVVSTHVLDSTYKKSLITDSASSDPNFIFTGGTLRY